MNTNLAKCKDCGTELKQEDKRCPKCGSESKSYDLSVSNGVILGETELSTTLKQRGYKKYKKKNINRLKCSRDPKLKGKKVKEEIVIDKEKDKYDHIVTDIQTGKIIHKEHEKLTEHRK